MGEGTCPTCHQVTLYSGTTNHFLCSAQTKEPRVKPKQCLIYVHKQRNKNINKHLFSKCYVLGKNNSSSILVRYKHFIYYILHINDYKSAEVSQVAQG